MRVITVARRPVIDDGVAANVLKYATGGLHIGVSLVPTAVGGGRWPGNVVLRHMPGCSQNGTLELVTHSRPRPRNVRGTDGAGGQSVYWKYAAIPDKLYGFAGANGTETITAWNCVSDCAVLSVDRQSAAFGREHASRYYHHIQGYEEIMEAIPQDLIAYLHDMITPQQGESLVTNDINLIDWADIPDGRYHGIIGRGEPTAEQVQHIWRVVRPGAHVFLIAPEHRKTGHIGACALEDGGFEIRDAVLFVGEEGDGERVHYVPKANSRERNAGCEHLAKRRTGPPLYFLTDEDLDEERLTEIRMALVEAGVAEDVVENLEDVGLPKDTIPRDIRGHFKKSDKSKKYGNNHPTVKAKEILKRLLRDVSSGATVLDPFMGSGSMALACMETGHDYLGIEKEPEYLEIADARVRHHDMENSRLIGRKIVSEAPTQPETVLEVEDGDALDMFGGTDP